MRLDVSSISNHNDGYDARKDGGENDRNEEEKWKSYFGIDVVNVDPRKI